MKHPLAYILLLFITAAAADDVTKKAPHLSLNEQGYLDMPGLSVTVFADTYPEGHQSGVTIIQHGQRTAANGDIRLETAPGFWSPVPRLSHHVINHEQGRISQTLTYPDPSRNRKGFNPIDYPKLRFSYKVNVTPKNKSSFTISIDLDKPLPQKWIGQVGFNLELYPKNLFGKSYRIGNTTGIFPPQAGGPFNQFGAAPLGQGSTLVVAPEEDLQRLKIQSHTGDLTLWDGRTTHNDGWFIVRTLISEASTKNSIVWTVTPNVINDWRYQPVMQVSQVGYPPKQNKNLIIEQDKRDTKTSEVTIFEISSEGKKPVFKAQPKHWGAFLNHQYFTLDFSFIDKPGMYIAQHQGKESHPFKIAGDVYSKNVWQPTLEYFLPVQMCHMKILERDRIWHGRCHKDDALMSPVNHNHFDGYISNASTLTPFKPGDRIPNLNNGGWHDGSDNNLEIKSQLDTIWLLSSMIEEFALNYDATTINPITQTVEIHKPDGKSDAIQQIEHGLASALSGYEDMGVLYRGIISPSKKQHSLLGETSLQTDGLPYSKISGEGKIKSGHSNIKDDRWVFTEDNAETALEAVATFAAAARVLKNQNPLLAKRCLYSAEKIYNKNHEQVHTTHVKIFALTELYLATNKIVYLKTIEKMEKQIILNIDSTGWRIARIITKVNNTQFQQNISRAIAGAQFKLQDQIQLTPYQVPYKLSYKGAGWGIQEYGIKQYFLHKSWPQHVTADGVFNALNFVLGVHPGRNTASFASGVGAKSALIAHGINRMDHSYIPGGVISGTGLVRPNFPELMDWPYFKQQTGYQVGNGAGNFMFLVLAAHELSQ